MSVADRHTDGQTDGWMYGRDQIYRTPVGSAEGPKNIEYSDKFSSDYLSNETSGKIFLQPTVTDKEHIANVISSLNSTKGSDPNSLHYKILFLKQNFEAIGRLIQPLSQLVVFILYLKLQK